MTFENSTAKKGTTEKQANLDKFQAVQNFAYRILCGAKKFDHITPLLKDLRWLTVRQQLYFRFAALVFKCTTGCAPEYLTSKLVRKIRRLHKDHQELSTFKHTTLPHC